MTLTVPPDLANVIARARKLTFEEARQLSALYDREPNTLAGQARKQADVVAKQRGLGDTRAEWLRVAGDAVIHAQTSEAWDPTHSEPWRWATQTVLDVVRAVLTRPDIGESAYSALTSPWSTVVDRSAEGSAPTPELGERRESSVRGSSIPFLDEHMSADDEFIAAAVLERANYAVAYLVVRAPDGTYRVTHRGTGQYDYFFDTLVAYDRWEADREVALLKRRFNLDGPRVAADVRYFDDRASAVAALRRLGD